MLLYRGRAQPPRSRRRCPASSNSTRRGGRGPGPRQKPPRRRGHRVEPPVPAARIPPRPPASRPGCPPRPQRGIVAPRQIISLGKCFGFLQWFLRCFFGVFLMYFLLFVCLFVFCLFFCIFTVCLTVCFLFFVVFCIFTVCLTVCLIVRCCSLLFVCIFSGWVVGVIFFLANTFLVFGFPFGFPLFWTFALESSYQYL